MSTLSTHDENKKEFKDAHSERAFRKKSIILATVMTAHELNIVHFSVIFDDF